MIPRLLDFLDFGYAAHLIHRWWKYRNGRYLIEGLPAVLAIVAAIVTARVGAVNADDLTARYRQQARGRFDAGDYPAALTCYERLSARTRAPEDTFGLARVAVAVGDEAWADSILDQLAPADRAGYPPAHLLRAQRLLRTGGDAAAIEGHLVRALRGLAEAPVARALPSPVQPAKARPADSNPAVEAVAVQGKNDKRAEAAVLLQRFADAVEFLQRNVTPSTSPQFRRLVGQTYLAWSDVVAQARPAAVAERLDLLDLALRNDPVNAIILERVLGLSSGDGPEAENGRAALRGLAADGYTTSTLHFALGSDAAERGRTDEARVHFEQALRLYPLGPHPANKLAWLLAHAQMQELPRARNLIDQVLKRWPDEPHFRNTRGIILYKMGRWTDALPDLVAALPARPNDAELHAALADIYDHLGAPDMAAEHRRRGQLPR